MSLPRGFKAKANRISLDCRKGLGIAPTDPLDLHSLARNLKIPIISLSAFKASHLAQVQQLTRKDRDAFSAVLIPLGQEKRIILVNDSHSIGRQNSSIAHEFSHVLLKHPPSFSFGTVGARNYDQGIEGEANCLASFLLIPNEAAWHIVKQSLPSSIACDFYGVSNDMLKYRLNTSGARIRFARENAYRKSSRRTF